MSDENAPGEDLEAGDSGGGVAVAERPGAVAVVETEQAQRAELRKDRFWLPFLIPVAAILTVALFTINISRIFLAASQDSKDPSTVVAVIVTLAVLFGATFIAARPKLRTSSLVLTMCGIAAIVLLSGSLVLGASENKEVVSAEPTGPAINTLQVDATNFQFQAKNFDVPAGINEIKYVSKEGSHTLAFDDPLLSYFLLTQPGGKSAQKADLVKGKTYTIYCTLPGHRAAGMESTITVTDAAPGAPEAGTATPSTTLAGPATTTSNPGNSETDQSQQSNTSSTGN